jgi:hypothetical protein
MWVWVLIISELHHFPNKPKDLFVEYIKNTIFAKWKKK